MYRRSLLALGAAGLASVAGCASGDSRPDDGATGDQTPTATPDPTPTDTPTPEPATVERVSMAGLQPAYIALVSPDSIGVYGDSAGQSLFLSVTPGPANPPARSAFAFELDGSTAAPVAETPRVWRRSEGQFGEAYTAETGGWLLFDLPATAENPDSAQLTWPGGSWQLPASVRQRLASENPTFDVTVTAPETIPLGEQPAITVTVENTSSVPGTFLMAVNRVGPHIAYAPEAAVRRLLDSGETATVTVTPSFIDPERIQVGDTTVLKFDWYGGATERELQFVAPDAG